MVLGEQRWRWLRLAAEYVDAGIVIHDPRGTVIWANERAGWMVGIAHDEMTGVATSDPRFRFFDPDGAALSHDDYPVVRVLTNPDAPYRDEEVGAVSPDGTTIWARVTATPVYEDDALVCVVVTFVDVTRRKSVEQAFARSEARLAAALSGTSDGVWYRELPDGATFFSTRFEELLGLEPGALDEDVEAFRALVHPMDRERLLLARDAYLAGKNEDFDVEVRVRHACGRYRWYRVRGRAESEAAGRPARFGGALQDITERKQAEAAQRILDQKLAETARLESLALLAGGVAHDFNNILVGVMSATDLALQSVEEPDTRELLELSLQSASRAAELTRQLLAYAGRAQLVLEAVELPAVIESVAKLAKGTVGSAARLELELEPTTPPVHCDPTQLKQVILNLIINGAQAVGERGGGTVTVRTRAIEAKADDLRALAPGRELPAGRYTLVEVSDDGVGMSPAVAERIFEPFFTTKKEGTGLGLAAVHGMVRGHGGFIEVDSEPGRGTRFALGLPAYEGGSVSTSQERPVGPARTREGLVAIVVDDEVAVRRVVDRALSAEGMKVEVFADGRALLPRLDAGRPDVLLLDVNLHGMNGLALLKRIRDRDVDLPVVLMSGYVDTEEQEILDWRYTRFLPKPFRIVDLDRCLDSLGLVTEDPTHEP